MKQAFIGRLFGKMALKSFIKDEKYFPRNVGSLTKLIVTDTHNDLGLSKILWAASIKQYSHLADDHEFVHGFFGKMNKQQTGLLAYKHTDHHLRQFGV